VARRPPAAARRGALDAGAVRALREDGKSLLPIGVVEVVSGEFERGEVVALLDPEGRESRAA
jgi:glutamate 5-kinase